MTLRPHVFLLLMALCMVAKHGESACLKIRITLFENKYNTIQDTRDRVSCCEGLGLPHRGNLPNYCGGRNKCDHQFKVEFREAGTTDFRDDGRGRVWTPRHGLDNQNVIHFNPFDHNFRLRHEFFYCRSNWEIQKDTDGRYVEPFRLVLKEVDLKVSVRDVDVEDYDRVCTFETRLDPMKFGRGKTTLCMFTSWLEYPSGVTPHRCYGAPYRLKIQASTFLESGERHPTIPMGFPATPNPHNAASRPNYWCSSPDAFHGCAFLVHDPENTTVGPPPGPPAARRAVSAVSGGAASLTPLTPRLAGAAASLPVLLLPRLTREG